jgi:hypothetical protein
MDLAPYLEALRRDLAATAAPGGPEVSHAAELLAGSLESAVRLGLLEALSDAAAEITAQLETASVEVRLRGREAELVVTETGPQVDAVPPPAAPQPDGGDLARITLRLPEPLKELVELAASAEGISVNAWLVRAVTAAVQGNPPGAPRRDRHGAGRRITGFAQA